MHSPTVAICMPSLGMVPARFAIHLAHLARATKLTISIVGTEGSLLPLARDGCIEIAVKRETQEWRFDYIFFLDTDVLVPPDALMRLVAHRKDIVGASYARRLAFHDVVVKSLEGGDLKANTGLIEVAGLPAGCLLIRRAIFDQLKKPYFRLRHDEATGETFGEDIVFCEMVRALGYRIWLDVDLTREVGHIGQKIFVAGPQPT